MLPEDVGDDEVKDVQEYNPAEVALYGSRWTRTRTLQVGSIRTL